MIIIAFTHRWFKNMPSMVRTVVAEVIWVIARVFRIKGIVVISHEGRHWVSYITHSNPPPRTIIHERGGLKIDTRWVQVFTGTGWTWTARPCAYRLVLISMHST